ncbi:MAG: polyhydroxyalkanoate synthesis repressor PhaR [Geminicoccaceae bacterium]|nr:polyhydroxyalkanoate synthesis repressor PhaR [Geminicoccaceae bacterium]MCS7267122.1 polyhydroxyalkanoate synthesis repressor PhaR [Geminicoccaceae bacterium]MCX7629936.1 polyhydroxyalkanoate synthesis repressor PhaR [Geminicoccaceae bacterium]MDW8125707.1 polyhydroxyalkanoate synthesis repressor PhaR [Geminicoccaceae bacterium]MDW8341706.1 polyhydroxyalkanoate synthesis repressor PhaR [Geminicoccaceae bacterium]
MAKARPAEDDATKPVAVVKKYANRRLYNTATSSYVTLEELAQMIRSGRDFVVYDAKTGEDITRSVLTQIILEEDSKGRNLLPISFLRQLISFYDDQLHAILPRYLELSMENFARHQDQIRAYVEQTFGRFFPLAQFEDMARQNIAMFQRAASVFSPFASRTEPQTPSAEQAPPAATPDPTAEKMRELEAKLEAVQRQLEQLVKATTGREREER